MSTSITTRRSSACGSRPTVSRLAISDGEAGFPHDKTLETQIIVCDVKTRAEVARLKGHTNSIYALAFSPDGKTLASGSMDQTVKLWDTATGALRETIVPGESGTSSGMGAGSRGGGSIGESGDPVLFDRDSGKPSRPQPRPIKAARRRAGLKDLVLDQYRRTTDLLLQTEIDLIDAESMLQMNTTGNSKSTYENSRQIVEAFKRDPAVASLIGKIAATYRRSGAYKSGYSKRPRPGSNRGAETPDETHTTVYRTVGCPEGGNP